MEGKVDESTLCLSFEELNVNENQEIIDLNINLRSLSKIDEFADYIITKQGLA